MKERKRILDRLDLMDEPSPRQPLVELYGERRVIIENHSGVTEYGRERVRVRVMFGSILICGSGLMLCRMRGQQLVITGSISAVMLDRGE